MKSKAQEYNENIKAKDAIGAFEKAVKPLSFKHSHGNSAQVSMLGECQISMHTTLSPDEALKLRDWLTDMFDVEAGAK